MVEKYIQEIKQLVRERVKERNKREKTVHLYCRKHLGEVFTGTIADCKGFEKEWGRRHDEHNKNLFLRIIDKLMFWGR